MTDWPEDLSELDEPIRNLVVAMNKAPGLVTLTSCGGHQESEIEFFDQVEAPGFYVTFMLERTYKGWRALDLLTSVSGNDGRVLGIYVDGSDDGEIYFALSGDGSVSPDEVASRISAKMQLMIR